uniref:Uncharacterized protein n=1 Tax=Leptobrachium leishanense TaxID=445787 RepID=A0A8C5QX38_9ANUR
MPRISTYPGNYTCYVMRTSNCKDFGNFSSNYCGTYRDNAATYLINHRQSLADVLWLCADMKICRELPLTWKGECSLAKVLMPLNIMPDTPTSPPHPPLKPLTQPTSLSQIPSLTPSSTSPQLHSRRRRAAISGTLDPHIYLDFAGVPRGVPNEFLARDPVKAEFEFLLPQIGINVNIGWINYIYYNQQRFINYTKEAFETVADQLGPTAQMTFQNRMALDMLLAEKGGVCKMLVNVDTCCTYIPNNTGPDGHLTTAINKLQTLAGEVRSNAGVSDPWERYFSWMSGWQRILAQIGIAVLAILILWATTVYCILPAGRQFALKCIAPPEPEHPYSTYLSRYRSGTYQPRLGEIML